MHSHKNNETRDRLRSRLNQRKEKFSGTVAASKVLSTSPYPNAAVKNPPKPSAPMGNRKLEKPPPPPLCPVLAPPRHSSVPRTLSEPSIGDEFKGQGSLATSKADNDSLHQSIFSISTCSINSLMKDDNVLGDNTDSRDIDDLLNYILGNKSVDKVALAQKKAAKKARQRQKKVCH